MVPDPRRGHVALHVLGRLGLVSLAVTLTAVALLGAGKLIVFNKDLSFPTITLPEVARSQVPAPSAPSATTGEPERPAILSLGRTVRESPPELPLATPTPAPLALTSFQFIGRSYTGVIAPEAGLAFVAPFAGKVEIRYYQLIGGQVYVNSNVASLPFFPYITLIDGERRMTYRPGVLGLDTELVVRDGDTVAPGDPLFRIVTLGRSSWATFYNRTVPYQVVVSLQEVRSGRDLDPTTLITTN